MGVLLSPEQVASSVEIVKFEIGDFVHFVCLEKNVYVAGHIRYFSSNGAYAYVCDPVKNQFYRVECGRLHHIELESERVDGYS